MDPTGVGMMGSQSEPSVVWRPPADARKTTRMGKYMDWLADNRGLEFATYDDLWRWSVADLEAFWSSIWEFFSVRAYSPYKRVLEGEMPDARWFVGATLNYAEHTLWRRGTSPALISESQTVGRQEITWDHLADQVGRARAGLVQLGVGRGDRVAAYLPNIPETVVAFLATASLGAVWSSCAPEFGPRAVIDRFRQIEPKVLLTVDGYRYGVRDIDLATNIKMIRSGLPSLEATVGVSYLDQTGQLPSSISWADLVGGTGDLHYAPVPFDHPLYVLFSSGTTGLPKPIVHGHGGILIEHLKTHALLSDIGPDDRFFWFTTTGWMMWNHLISNLAAGSTLVLFDGDPSYPDLSTLWQLAESTGITWFGTSAGFLMGCRAAGLRPGNQFDLKSIRAVGSTGSPLPAEGFRWVYEEVGSDLLLSSVSGGTDVCSAFVGGCRLVPVWTGEISCRYLGAKVEAFDSAGRSVVGKPGELVVTKPMPSMPVGFWGDKDGSRYRQAYFADYPGVWRHGDWITITERGSCIISGRSDATLNRGGVRLGTGDFYAAVADIPGVVDSLVVHLGDSFGGGDKLVLLVQLIPGAELDRQLEHAIKETLRSSLSPRHVPDEIYQVPSIPTTLSGKKLELPVKKILAGADPGDVASSDALKNPESLEAIRQLAEQRTGT
jgi:acetoacetyl-CoA synthetase